MILDVPGRALVLGVVHLRPLPGSPGWSGSMREVGDAALADALSYERAGFDGIIIENFGDAPFAPGAVDFETVAAMAAVARRIRSGVALPVGFNVLRNDACAALGLCAACGGELIRVNVHTGAMLTDQGVIEGDAFSTLRRRAVLCPEVKIIADVLVKHAVALAPQPLEHVARDALERGRADGLIVSGSSTGAAVDLDDLRRVREACPGAPLFAGSGVGEANVGGILAHASGVIVGTSVKRDGVVGNPVDEARARRLVEAARRR